MLTYRIEPNSPKSTYFKNKLPDKKKIVHYLEVL